MPLSKFARGLSPIILSSPPPTPSFPDQPEVGERLNDNDRLVYCHMQSIAKKYASGAHSTPLLMGDCDPCARGRLRPISSWATATHHHDSLHHGSRWVASTTEPFPPRCDAGNCLCMYPM